MNLVDLAIILAVALGVLMGWSRGLIGPLLAEATFLIGIFVISKQPNLVAGLVPQGIPGPVGTLGLLAAISVVVGVVGRLVLGMLFRLPLARKGDKLVGAVAHGALALVLVYVLLIGVASADKVLAPINAVASIRSPQLQAMQSLLSQYPQAAGIVNPSELGRLANVASGRAVPFDQLGQYAKAINWYEHDLRPQVKTSRIAPIVMQIGRHLPIIGQQIALPTS
jgi:uncharacterized membrane protein required for colicin V production